ncbi:tetratricopeptide repeat protein 23-like [Argopecten irradians]|uniref:tetratricopeptide repeat protein 23-like n=1 Tax=Argopecten irradians TaxID=31199 RepID=UPI00370FD923
MSDEEDYSAEEGRPMVIEVKTNKRPSSRTQGRRSARTPRTPKTQRSQYNDNEDDYSDEFDEDFDDEEEMADDAPRTSHIKSKPKNGRKKVNMTPPDRLLKTSTRKANKFMDQGKVDKCIQEYVKCIAYTRMVHGPVDWRLARSYADLAEAYLDHKSYAAQADYHADNGKAILLNSPPTITTETEKANVYTVLFRLYRTKGRALTALKKFPEAEQVLAKADKFLADLFKMSCVTQDECDEMEIDISHAKARLYWKQKKHALASSQYDKLLDQMESHYGKDSMELVPVYQENGQLEQSKGRHADHDKAIEMYLQAHSIAGANYREDNLVTMDTALSLARAYSQTGREEAEGVAEKYLNECLAICQTCHGSNHKKTLEVMDELSRLLIRVDRQEEALSILRSSLTGKCEAYGDYSEQVSDTYKLIASVHLSGGATEKAIRAYQKCHNIECLVLGKNSKKAKDSERTIEILMSSPGLSNKFSLSKSEELKKRPKFNSIVNRSKPMTGT